MPLHLHEFITSHFGNQPGRLALTSAVRPLEIGSAVAGISLRTRGRNAELWHHGTNDQFANAVHEIT
jgi:hypothetical protein